jgi:hypothetical protein
MAERPQLVQFADLTPAHFAAHPCWIQCHVVDYDQPWHDDTDEETFRPWTGPLPVDPSEGMLLVAADLTLADGTALTGFVTPAFPKDAQDSGLLGFQQPQIFLPSGRRESFWDGGFSRPAEARKRFYAEWGRAPDQVFPVRFAARAGLTTGLASGEVPGFCAFDGPGTTVRVAR